MSLGFSELVYGIKTISGDRRSKHILHLLPRVKRFIVVGELMPSQSKYNLSGGDTIEASPFDVYTIEINHKDIALSFWEKNGQEILTNCILVDDTDPNNRRMYSLCQMGDKTKILSLPVDVEELNCVDKEIINDLYRLFNCFVNDFIKFLNSKHTEVNVEKSKSLVASIPSKKYKPKFSDVIYIKDSGETCSKSFLSKHTGGWVSTHKWSVRGHWRKCDETTLGKNRSGERCVIGKTWVNDFQKGKGDLINKIRVIK